MTAEYISLDPESPDASEISRVAKALADGALVVFPTETVYGVAANAAISDSVDRLCAIKERQSSQPFTVHIGQANQCKDYVSEIGSMGRRFIRKGWPGPITLVFRVAEPASTQIFHRLCDAGAERIYVNGTVGLRNPDHAVSQALLQSASAPIIATSANLSGREAPVEAESIRGILGEKVDIILDDGPTRYRKSSTIVGLNGKGYQLIRSGVWDERTIRRLSTVTILFICSGNTCRSPMAEGLCKQMIAARLGCEIKALPDHGILVQSAGTMGLSGCRASQEAIEVCRKRGIDIAGHRSRDLTAERLHPADYIFAMARHHIDTIHSISSTAENRAVLLKADGEIADPIGGSEEDYETIAQLITRSLKQRLDEVEL